MSHTLVIGAGIVGASVAVARAVEWGDRVTIVTAHPSGGLASAASFGWINASFFLSEAHFRLRHQAMGYHRNFGNLPPGRPAQAIGCLWYEEGGAAQDDFAYRLRALGYSVEQASRSEIAARLPALGTVPDTALHFTDEDAVDPADLARALIAASGATVIQAEVMALAETHGRIVGVQTGAGFIAADRVVLAAGIGAPDLLAPLGLTLPMLTRPGMIVATNPLPPICPVILATPGQEVRQDGAGRLLAPASANHQSDNAEVLGSFPVMVNDTLGRLRKLFPGQDIRYGSHAIAQRPVPGDGLPVVGESRVPGLWIAVMHSGATLAPLIGALMAAEMESGPESPLLKTFRPQRFGC